MYITFRVYVFGELHREQDKLERLEGLEANMAAKMGINTDDNLAKASLHTCTPRWIQQRLFIGVSVLRGDQNFFLEFSEANTLGESLQNLQEKDIHMFALPVTVGFQSSDLLTPGKGTLRIS